MSLNKTMLIGNLGADPEFGVTKAQDPYCTFSVATNEVLSNLDGTKEKHTEWHTVTAFGKIALNSSKYLKKGSRVYIEGKLRTTSFLGKDGVEKHLTKIIPVVITFLDTRGGLEKHEQSIEIIEGERPKTP